MGSDKESLFWCKIPFPLSSFPRRRESRAGTVGSQSEWGFLTAWSNRHPGGIWVQKGLMFQHEVRNVGAVANQYRYSGFPLTTGGNDEKRGTKKKRREDFVPVVARKAGISVRSIHLLNLLF